MSRAVPPPEDLPYDGRSLFRRVQRSMRRAGAWSDFDAPLLAAYTRAVIRGELGEAFALARELGITPTRRAALANRPQGVPPMHSEAAAVIAAINAARGDREPLPMPVTTEPVEDASITRLAAAVADELERRAAQADDNTPDREDA